MSMSYEGTITINCPTTPPMLAYLHQFLGADIREHPEWDGQALGFTFIDLKFTPDRTGLMWDYSEKTYGLESALNYIERNMQLYYAEFELVGELHGTWEGDNNLYHIHKVDGKFVETCIDPKKATNVPIIYMALDCSSLPIVMSTEIEHLLDVNESIYQVYAWRDNCPLNIERYVNMYRAQSITEEEYHRLIADELTKQ